ncbi:kinase-like domain-containing protein [Syncephalis pseudoplumigaleata]|uniref:Kinase-like domain-containing protein n=1 Tax=Syncephalis pseudoplumigaleata TaxID=1712513 RepID=A0A4P9YTJ8_9FUNG|nr:kinase-like domain-containing protein [Syncephalis pseudoplumigaleata]|eukprot:RKP22481.1 kinase-like domain-containing protein [Syncephalis pseudoplumigaleata]
MAGSGKGKEPAALPAAAAVEPAATASTSPSSCRIVGSYALGPELGCGAFGSVYRGTSSKTGQMVAVKETVWNVRSMLEWRAMAMVSGHAHIVRAVEMVECAERVFYVLEFAHGGDLFSYAENKGFRLQEEEVRAITRQIISALLHINECGVAHLDLKLENVLFKDAGHSHVLLADFGAAEVLGESSAPITRPTGTISYMAPEVLACYNGMEDVIDETVRRGFDMLADNWSLGVLVHVLLHGCFPFVVLKRKESATAQRVRDQLVAILARRPLFANATQQSCCSKKVS